MYVVRLPPLAGEFFASKTYALTLWRFTSKVLTTDRVPASRVLCTVPITMTLYPGRGSPMMRRRRSNAYGYYYVAYLRTSPGLTSERVRQQLVSPSAWLCQPELILGPAYGRTNWKPIGDKWTPPR